VYDVAIQRSFAQGEVLVPGTYVDATLSVDAQLVQPRDDQYIQLACREREPTTEYRFGFDPSTGQGWINRWYRWTGAPPYTSLAETFTSPIPDGSSFRISLSCTGTSIIGAINGVTIVSASDNTLGWGQFWIAVGESPGGSHPDMLAEARFTELSVTQGPWLTAKSPGPDLQLSPKALGEIALDQEIPRQAPGTAKSRALRKATI